MERDETPKRSPWGAVQYVTRYPNGIIRVTTAGHGGFKLSRALNAKVHPIWRRKGGWYEEDCEAAIVILTFPEAFGSATCKSAATTAKDCYPDEYREVTGIAVAPAESRVLRRRAFVEKSKGKYVAISACGSWHRRVPNGMVGVYAKIAESGETKWFLIPADEYNADGFFVEDPAQYQEIAPLVPTSE